MLHPTAKRITHNIFFTYHHKVIERILARPSCVTLVAHHPDDPNTIFGYLVFERHPECTVLHYAYVKQAFRGLGVATLLITSAGIDLSAAQFSHWTHEVNALLERHPGLTYNPYAI